MLYRYWMAPLTFNKKGFPCIILKNVSAGKGNIVYVKDYFGHVMVSNPIALNLVKKLAKRDWLGIVCYRYVTSREYFRIGNYRLSALYAIYPPIQTDGRYDHVNLKLANRHVPYPSVKIYVHDPTNSVLKIYPHMEEFRIKRVKNGWLIAGKSPKNGLVEVEFVLKHGVIGGFYRNTSNVLDLTESANSYYYFRKSLVKPLEMTFIALIIGFPAIVLLVYRKYGKEKRFVVPEFLNYVPNPNRKPWHVNVVFTGDAMTGDKNALFSTLLDLYRRGAIDLEPYSSKGFIRKKNELKIKILDRNKFDENDSYERQVLKFLEKYSENNVLDTKKLKMVAKDRKSAPKLARDLRKLLNWTDWRFSSQFVEAKGRKIFYLTTLFFFIIFLVTLAGGGGVLAILPATLTAQSICCALSPSQLLGRWKNDFYREELEWESFRKFLSDMAMLKKYAPEDIKIWKEWLVYGTALGVGDEIVRVMKSLNIEIPEVEIHYSWYNFNTIYHTSHSKSSGGGGGFGAGGGFGGGGAGGI